jgi:response regulator RpfG family c-di-GMP phosphodiesterase
LPNEEVVEITRAQRGTSFDPKVVDAFVKVRKDLEVIQREYVGN